jgi:hypothetical protein
VPRHGNQLNPRQYLAQAIHQLELEPHEQLPDVRWGKYGVGPESELQFCLLHNHVRVPALARVGAMVEHQMRLNDHVDIIRLKPNPQQGILKRVDVVRIEIAVLLHVLGIRAGINENLLAAPLDVPAEDRQIDRLAAVVSIGKIAHILADIG